MKLKEIHNLIILIANIGVLIGIIALGIELRQTQIALEAGAYQARALDSITTNRGYAESPELARMFIDKFEVDPETLDQVERLRLTSFARSVMVDHDNEHY